MNKAHSTIPSNRYFMRSSFELEALNREVPEYDFNLPVIRTFQEVDLHSMAAFSRLICLLESVIFLTGK